MRPAPASPAPTEFDRPLLLPAERNWLRSTAKVAGQIVALTLAAAGVLVVLSIFLLIIKESLSFFADGGDSGPGGMQGLPVYYDLSTSILGSGVAIVGALLIAVPIGLSSAVFLSDFAPHALRRVVKPITELLSSIPSVVYGFFAVTLLMPRSGSDPDIHGLACAATCAVILAIMAIPTIISISENAMSSVGWELRQGAYALGSTRMETILRVVVPAAGRGILAAVILGMTRAIGEAALVWQASAAVARTAHPWWDIAESVGKLTASLPDHGVATSAAAYRDLFTLGLLLMVLTFALNLISELLVRRRRWAAPPAGYAAPDTTDNAS